MPLPAHLVWVRTQDANWSAYEVCLDRASAERVAKRLGEESHIAEARVMTVEPPPKIPR